MSLFWDVMWGFLQVSHGIPICSQEWEPLLRGISLNVLTRESQYNAGYFGGSESSDLNIKLHKIRPKARGSQPLCYVFSNWHCWKLVVEFGGGGIILSLYGNIEEENKIINIRKVSIKICIWDMFWPNSNIMRTSGISLKTNFSWPPEIDLSCWGTRRTGLLLLCLFVVLYSSAESLVPQHPCCLTLWPALHAGSGSFF